MHLLTSRSGAGKVDLFEPRVTPSRQELPHCDAGDPDEEPAGRVRLLGRRELGRETSVPIDDSQDGKAIASGV
ncbi:MAG TPA: hypothetical protein VKN76_00165, partial [Kiloniellaceae bacterium]|nr:hypothetical protein [Kiloniellaceae bacterium]